MVGESVRYGVPYQGSKNTIAAWVIEQLPPAEVFVDLFAGGCAVTHAAMLSGKYQRFIANDMTGAPSVFLAATKGEFRDFATVLDREQFQECADMALKLMYSFGNSCKSYLWSAELEGVKVNASRMLSAPSMYERRMAYRRFLRALRAYIEQTGTLPDDAAHDGSLQSLERLERLTVKQLDYRCVEIPEGTCVYADPPYRGTNCGHYGGFDIDVFDAWLACVPFPVYVSEYTCPAGCVEVANTQKTVTSAATQTNTTTERLFVQERFADDYYTAMCEANPTLFDGVDDV